MTENAAFKLLANLETPESCLELRISCKKLAKMDLCFPSDPVVVCQVLKEGAWQEVGRTEYIHNDSNPKFTTAFRLEYRFATALPVRFNVYDFDKRTSSLEKAEFIGSLQTTLSEIVSAPSSILEGPLANPKISNPGFIRVVAEETLDYKDVLRGSSLGVNSSIESVAFKRVSRLRGFPGPLRITNIPPQDGSYALVYQSEVQHKSVNPGWAPASVPVVHICNRDYERPLLVEVMDWSRFGKHSLVGYCSTTVHDLMAAIGSELLLSNAHDKKGGLHGKVYVSACRIEKSETFLDYLHAGAQLSMTVAIDFSKSNGDFGNPASLHYLSNSRQNSYQEALRAIGGVLEPYDSDRKFPVYGFGGALPDGSNPPFFALNGNAVKPEVVGTRGILSAYENAVNDIIPIEPTRLAPVIHSVCDKISQGLAIPSVGGAQNYHVLVVVTDGQIDDMEESAKAVIRGSKLPLSMIIVGIGKQNFDGMDLLDADDNVLEVHGEVAERDIVQFVPIRELTSGDLSKLTEEVLREIPSQYMKYMKSHNVKPIPVVDPKRSDWRLY
ncbi:Copine-domain-containing protein, partial [Basidiobolus meristosporus CBS 931.73]